MRKLSLLLIASGVISLSATAQEGESYTGRFSTWSAGLDVGVNHFYGDMTGFYAESNIDGHNLGFGASLYLNKWFNHLIGVSGNLGYNSYTGKNMNAYFTSSDLNAGLDMMVNVSSLINKGSYAESRWSWIPFAGVGISSSMPRVYDASDAIIVDRTERHNEVILRGGINLKYKLTNSLDLDLRYLGTMMMVSDWADNISSGDGNDGNHHLRIGLTYNFGATEDRPAIVYARPINDLATKVDEIDEKMNQLTTDSDGDGVADYMDKDDNTPEGYTVDGSGRAMDVDRDGIADDLDQDPFTPRGAQVDATGRELDDDGDGVPNSRDEEPNTAEGKMVNFQGREIKSGLGGEMANAFLPDIFFNFNSARLTSANEQRLLTIAKIMLANEDVEFKVIGRADPVGSEKYNLNLSERRAQAVVDALVNNYGISADRLEVVGLGESAQVGTDRTVNRRVEFELK